MHAITNLRQNVSSGCQGALHPQARFGGQLGLKIPAFRSEIAGPTARRWANMQLYLRPSGGQDNIPYIWGLGYCIFVLRQGFSTAGALQT